MLAIGRAQQSQWSVVSLEAGPCEFGFRLLQPLHLGVTASQGNHLLGLLRGPTVHTGETPRQ
jgi:hypothetical protein